MKRTFVAVLAALFLVGCASVPREAPSEGARASEAPPAVSEVADAPAPSETALKDPTTMPPDFWKHAFDGVGKPGPLPGVEIRGDKDFTARITDALAFMGKCDPAALAFVQRRIAVIEPSESAGGGWVRAGDRVAGFSARIVDPANVPAAVATWYLASSLAHEAEHVRQHAAGYRMQGLTTDAQHSAVERDAGAVQLGVLKECLGALPKVASVRKLAANEIAYMEKYVTGDVPCDECKGYSE